MVSPGITSGIGALIDFEFPGSDLAAVVPYVLPLIFVGTVFLLYQRYMPRTERNRNLLVLGGGVCYLLSFVLVLYAGFGAIWWGADEHTIGSDVLYAKANSLKVIISFLILIISELLRKILFVNAPNVTLIHLRWRSCLGLYPMSC